MRHPCPPGDVAVVPELSAAADRPLFDRGQACGDRGSIGRRVSIHEEQDVPARLTGSRIPRGSDVTVPHVEDADTTPARGLTRAVGGNVVDDEDLILCADLISRRDQGIQHSEEARYFIMCGYDE